MIVVGIDIASEKHDFFMLQQETGIVFSKTATTILNSDLGFKRLHSDIQSFCEATGDSNVRVGLESTGIYQANIIAFLIAQDYQVMMINPILTNMARKASKVHCPKNDNLDSQTICKYLIDHTDEFLPYTLSQYHISALKSLSRKRFFVAKELGKAKLEVNRLVHIIFPEYKSFFSNLYCESSIAILKKYGGPKKLAKAHLDTVKSLLHGRCKCSAEQLIEAARHSVGIDEEFYCFELMDAIREMEHIQTRIDAFDMEIAKYVDELCPNLLSIPGVGYVTAGLIAGEIGDINRFHSAESLVSYAGLDVTVYESGKYKASNLVPSKKGSRYLRYALFLVADSIRKHDPTFEAYYHKKISEGKHHFVALGHIQKKLARVIYSIMKSGSTYQEQA